MCNRQSLARPSPTAPEPMDTVKIRLTAILLLLPLTLAACGHDTTDRFTAAAEIEGSAVSVRIDRHSSRHSGSVTPTAYKATLVHDGIRGEGTGTTAAAAQRSALRDWQLGREAMAASGGHVDPLSSSGSLC